LDHTSTAAYDDKILVSTVNHAVLLCLLRPAMWAPGSDDLFSRLFVVHLARLLPCPGQLNRPSVRRAAAHCDLPGGLLAYSASARDVACQNGSLIPS
jgi:hypothetical protein